MNFPTDSSSEFLYLYFVLVPPSRKVLNSLRKKDDFSIKLKFEIVHSSNQCCYQFALFITITLCAVLI